MAAEQDARPTKSRRVLPIALVILATIVGFISVFAIWAKRQLLETDTWVDTSTELLQNEDIQASLSAFLVNELYDNVDVNAAIADRLPPKFALLAGPIGAGVHQLAGSVSERVLAEPKVQDLWSEANRVAHGQFLKIIDDKGEAISTGNGTVTLNLGTILSEITQQLGISADLASKLPPEAAQLEIIQSDELATAQTVVKLLRTLAWALLALTLLLFAAAIYLAGERRRETLRAVGFAFIEIGALVFIAHRIGGDQVVSSLSDSASADSAIDAAWTIGTSQLTDIAAASVLYGIVIVMAAWLAGPTRFATALRSGIAPWYRQPQWAYGTLAVLLIGLFWWDPTQGTHRLAPSILLILLLTIGTEFLRRQIAREFPDRVATGSSQGIAQTIAAQMRKGNELRTGLRRPAEHGAAEGAGDRRIAELERLGKLREQGILTDEEFASEKTRVLAAG
jgi:hypothetical protein